MRMYDVKIGLQVEAGTQGEAISRAGQVMEALEAWKPILIEIDGNLGEISSTVDDGRYIPFHYNYTTGLATEIHPDP